jgi:adenylyltransferase/sulfurtransferase
MLVRILIPTPLRPYAEKQESVQLDARTVGEALGLLTGRYAELRKHLYADDGRLRSFVNVYVNDEDIRSLQKDKTTLQEGDIISIIPSIAGGIDLCDDESICYAVDLLVRRPAIV